MDIGEHKGVVVEQNQRRVEHFVVGEGGKDAAALGVDDIDEEDLIAARENEEVVWVGQLVYDAVCLDQV